MGVPILGRHRMAVEATDIVNLFSVVCECGYHEAAPYGEEQALDIAESHLRSVGRLNVPKVFL